MPAPTLSQIKSDMRATWMSGDFGAVAKNIYRDGKAFIDRLHIQRGMRVLDVATGTGNLALPAARAGAIVTGVDIAPNLVMQAHYRAVEEGLTIQFDEGDAEALPYAGASFDLVVTMFGAMFAPRPNLVASEMARVLKPGGRLAMANWSPTSFTGLMFKTKAQHVPPTLGIPAPILWGEEATARQRLSPYFNHIETSVIPLKLDYQLSAMGVVDFHRKYFGPTQATFAQLDDAGKKALAEDLANLYQTHNVATDSAEHVVINNQYLQVTAKKPC